MFDFIFLNKKKFIIGDLYDKVKFITNIKLLMNILNYMKIKKSTS